MKIEWESATSYLLLNPSYSPEQQTLFQQILKQSSLQAHIWLSTSGSSSLKWVGLSKEALLASAAAVNSHLNSTEEDVWVNALPFFHVGGLSISARSFLSGASLHDFKEAFPGKWCVEKFYHYLSQNNGTLTSLVPAQLHDLVEKGWRAPASLRAMIIGGGSLSPILYQRAIEGGWPVLPSYGLTECASQVATASLNSSRPGLKLLSHLKACVKGGRLAFAGSSLLSCYAFVNEGKVQFSDPKVEGWLLTEDRGSVEQGLLQIIGRADAIIKVGGENVDLSLLEGYLQSLSLELHFSHEALLMALPDPRLGQAIILVTTCQDNEQLTPLLHAFQQKVLPFERIRKVYQINQIPRSSLGKILKEELLTFLSQMNPFTTRCDQESVGINPPKC